MDPYFRICCPEIEIKVSYAIPSIQFIIWILFQPDKGVLIPPALNSGIADAPGEMGRPVVLPTNMSSEMKKAVDDGWLKNAFNQYASDLISIHRSLPDPRDPW